jgi:methyl-accepting chemotaxis protein
VKALANQTARATEEIANQVRAIQDATESSAQAIQSITGTIHRVNEIAGTIAAAVEDQGGRRRRLRATCRKQRPVRLKLHRISATSHRRRKILEQPPRRSCRPPVSWRAMVLY